MPASKFGSFVPRYTPPWHADGEQHQGGHRQIFPCKGMDNLNQITGRGRGMFTSTLSSAMSGKEFAATVSTLPMADQQTIRTSLVKSWGEARQMKRRLRR